MTTTVPDTETAERMSHDLLDARLVACVQELGPITSRYRWRGEVETSTERLLIVKTTAARAGEVVDAIVRAHPYEEPEVLVTPVVAGASGYLSWVASEVTAQAADPPG